MNIPTSAYETLRGPAPPAAVCPCGVVVSTEWVNPVLERARREGRYDGDVRGGSVTCQDCERAYVERISERRVSAIDAFVATVPTWARGARLGDSIATDANRSVIARLSAWVSERDRDLFLFGPPGSGKTHFAIAAVSEVLRGRYARSGLFVRVPALLRALREGFAADGDSEGAALFRRCRSAEVVILDDLGAEHSTGFASSTIEGLYSERLDAGKVTIITSNLPLRIPDRDLALPEGQRDYAGELGAHLGDDRMPSRIAGFAEVIEVRGQDFRLAGWRNRRKV